MLYFLLIISVRSSYHVLLYTLGDSGGTRLSHAPMSKDLYCLPRWLCCCHFMHSAAQAPDVRFSAVAITTDDFR